MVATERNRENRHEPIFFHLVVKVIFLVLLTQHIPAATHNVIEPGTPENLLRNPGFETVGGAAGAVAPEEWRLVPDAAEDAPVFTLESGRVRGSRQALRVAHRRDTSYSKVDTTFPTKPDTAYVASVGFGRPLRDGVSRRGKSPLGQCSHRGRTARRCRLDTPGAKAGWNRLVVPLHRRISTSEALKNADLRSPGKRNPMCVTGICGWMEQPDTCPLADLRTCCAVTNLGRPAAWRPHWVVDRMVDGGLPAERRFLLKQRCAPRDAQPGA